MTIPYETGTADDHRDLRDKFINFVTTNSDLVSVGQQWQLVTSDADNAIFKGTGLSGTDEIFFGMFFNENVGADIYNWSLYGMTGYNPLTPFAPTSHPNSSANVAYMGIPYRNNTMKYWFVANGRRIVVVVKVDTRYVFGYFGLYIPYVRPSLFPYPYTLMGTNNNGSKFTDNTEHNSFGCIPQAYEYNALMLDGSFIWRGLRASTDDYTINPIRQFNVDGVVPYYGLDSTSYPLYPYILLGGTDSANYGELDGVYWIPGIGLAAESIITIGDSQFLVVPNVHRSDISNWTAIQIAE